MNKVTIKDLDLRGKRVFIRVDFNVPLKDGVVTDDTRIRETLPTLKLAIEKGGRLVLASLAAAAVLLAVVGVLFASADPDGLESLAARVGIAAQAHSLFSTPVADYELTGTGVVWLRKAAAGLAGLAAITVVTAVLGRVIGRRRRS